MRIQADLIDFADVQMVATITGHVEDHFTKYHILFPLKTKLAQEVSTAIQE